MSVKDCIQVRVLDKQDENLVCSERFGAGISISNIFVFDMLYRDIPCARKVIFFRIEGDRSMDAI